MKLKRATVYSIAQVVFFSIAVLLVVSFSRQGLILVRINDLLVQLFSWTAIFLPFVFLSFGFMISKFKIPLSQPNVVVGAILFLLSVASASKAGVVGRYIWDGIEALVTPAGAYMMFFGAAFVGLVVFFNTSVDRVLSLVAVFLVQVRKYLVGEAPQLLNIRKTLSKDNLLPRREIKVTGAGGQNMQAVVKKVEHGTKGNILTSQLVSNVPGQDKLWEYPPVDLLQGDGAGKADRGDIKNNADIIEKTLESFGITARVVEVNLGPAVTQYALEVALGTKLSKITALERDLALALAAPTGTIRIEAPIPGRSLVGIELPNRVPEFVPLKKMLESDVMNSAKSKLTLALGLDVSGKPIVADLARMPHVLIAGQTGSGKSVCINAFLTSMLFRASPSEVKFILVDPKRVELTTYNGIPHLLSPVIVEPEKVLSALRWILSEMDRRYKLFAQAGARNIESYNDMSGFQALPYIVLIIDELADIMLFSPTEVEDSITRIAQMSRATGIHMILATQRPSVDVITGLIKANVPSRIAFAVSSLVDSRVILDTQGAEKLLGRGDMLFLPPEQAKPMRIQGAFLADREISLLISYLKGRGVNPQYTEEVTEMPKSSFAGGAVDNADEFFADAVRLVCQFGKASASLLQRRLSVGYARAARIIDQLEAAGVVGPSDGSSKPREVLIKDAESFLSSQKSG
ncbi:hypothetical protein A2873_01475 [Candidatus Woesebacteria bacterium RIFCSPHIGHO2_01_FULL_42_80]|nr:MAG: hypothetical protein A2873_01475 [Candidatus Woesebacteria bacterium RIFCSPHIGHO2_01_FULL_42_80]